MMMTWDYAHFDQNELEFHLFTPLGLPLLWSIEVFIYFIKIIIIIIISSVCPFCAISLFCITKELFLKRCEDWSKGQQRRDLSEVYGEYII